MAYIIKDKVTNYIIGVKYIDTIDELRRIEREYIVIRKR